MPLEMNLREIWKEDTILDAGGNRSTRRKPAWASMDWEPNSHSRLGIEPGPRWWKAREQPLRQPARHIKPWVCMIFKLAVSSMYVILEAPSKLAHTNQPLSVPAFIVRTHYTHMCIVCLSQHSKRGQICV